MQTYNSNIIAIFSSVFMVAIPLVTYFYYIENDDISKLLFLLLVNSFSITLYCIFYIRREIKFDVKINFSAAKFVFLTLASFVPLALLVINALGEYSIESLRIFSESYRQSEFVGSGVYTIWITQIIPILILIILITNGWSRSLLIPILLVVVASLILGLRVYLWSIVFALFLQLSRNLSFAKVFFAFFGVLLLVFYKLFLLSEESTDIINLFVRQLIRPDLHAVVKNDMFSDSLFDLIEYFPVVRRFFGHELSDFKNYYVPTIPNVNVLMPYINLNSGVALPAYAIHYNIFFIFAGVLNALLIASIFEMMRLLSRTRSVFNKILLACLMHVVSISLFEDIGGFYKIEELIFLVPIAYLCMIAITRDAARK